jgi:hypothetical protein
MTPVTIPLSKGKLLLTILGGCAFVAIGIWMWRSADDYSGFKHWKALVGAGLCVPCFGLGVLVLTYKLFDSRPGLVLNDEGIHRLGLFTFWPPIPWKHITHCSITKVKRTSMLAIHVDNEQEILARLGPFTRWLKRMSIAQYGAPHVLASANLKIGIQELKELIEKGAAAHRERS